MGGPLGQLSAKLSIIGTAATAAALAHLRQLANNNGECHVRPT